MSNYDAVVDSWRMRFLEMEPETLARRFRLELDAEYLYLKYFSLPFAISRADGTIRRLDRPGAEIGFNTAINFYNMFHYAVEAPTPSGELVPFRNVKRVYPFEAAYTRSILEPFRQRFTGRTEALARACEALGGARLPQGDVGYVLEILPGLRLAVTFWDADDEFPAQANMLFDSNITDFMHEENVVCVASDAVRYLSEAAGLTKPAHLMGSDADSGQ